MSVKTEARVSLQDIGTHVKSTWSGLRNRAGMSGTPMALDGIQGYRVAATLSEIMLREVPMLKLLPRDQFPLVAAEIRTVLRQGKNARCLESLKGKVPVWWVSDTYADVAVVGVPMRRPAPIGEGGRQDPKAEAERRLTPHEAGEDRVPEPVVIEYKHGIVLDPTLQPTDLVLEILRQFKDQPLVSTEIAYVMGDLKPPHSRPSQASTGRPVIGKQPIAGYTTLNALEKLVKTDKIFKRKETMAERNLRADASPGETAAGRAAYLYSLNRRVPLRTEVEVVPGYRLKTAELPRDAGAEKNAAIREERNTRTLDALIEAGKPMSVTQLANANTRGLSSGQIADSFKDLLEAGLVHHGPFERNGRKWGLIDWPIEPTPAQEPEPEPEPTSSSPELKDAPVTSTDPLSTPGLSPAHLAILRALRERGKPATAQEISKITRYDDSTVRDAFRRADIPIVGHKHGARVFSWPELVPSPPPFTPSIVVTLPAAPVRAESDPLRDAVAVLAAAHGLAPSEDVEALKARVIELEAALAKAKDQIRRLTE